MLHRYCCLTFKLVLFPTDRFNRNVSLNAAYHHTRYNHHIPLILAVAEIFRLVVDVPCIHRLDPAKFSIYPRFEVNELDTIGLGLMKIHGII